MYRQLTVMPDWVPVIDGVMVSVAVIDCVPVVFSVALKVCVPLSGAKGADGDGDGSSATRHPTSSPDFSRGVCLRPVASYSP